MKYAIALSGGIASGKSTACSFLKLYGYGVICADEVAHRVLEESQSEVVEVFGKEILEDSKINRKILGNIVFNDEIARKKLENILHPKIKKEILKKAESLDKSEIPYFVDIPLFFETRNYEISETLLIYTQKEIQIERLMKRNHLSKEEALKRIALQMPLDEKKKLASYVIDNSKGVESLQAEIEKYLGNYLKK